MVSVWIVSSVLRAFGYLASLDAEIERRCDHVTGTLVRLVDGPS